MKNIKKGGKARDKGNAASAKASSKKKKDPKRETVSGKNIKRIDPLMTEETEELRESVDKESREVSREGTQDKDKRVYNIDKQVLSSNGWIRHLMNCPWERT